MTNRDDVLTCRRITKCYGSIKALNDVTLIWERGKITSVLGPSGSGKTTLGEMFAGLVRPDAGKILVGSDDITDWKPNRRKISLMPQEWELFPHLTVLENVGFGLWASGADKKSRHERSFAYLSTVGLSGREQSLTQELSGGQQQRVALARALAAPNPYIVLDEPFSSVDQDTRCQLRDLLVDESRQGRGILLITHDRTDALILSDTIHCLNGGVLSMSGSPKQVYSEPVSLQAALLTGPAFLVPVFHRDDPLVGTDRACTKVRRSLPVRHCYSSHHSELDQTAFAVARPEWLQLSTSDEFHLIGTISSSSYSGSYYAVTLMGECNRLYQAYLDVDLPLGTIVPLSVKPGIELPIISTN